MFWGVVKDNIAINVQYKTDELHLLTENTLQIGAKVIFLIKLNGHGEGQTQLLSELMFDFPVTFSCLYLRCVQSDHWDSLWMLSLTLNCIFLWSTTRSGLLREFVQMWTRAVQKEEIA